MNLTEKDKRNIISSPEVRPVHLFVAIVMCIIFLVFGWGLRPYFENRQGFNIVLEELEDTCTSLLQMEEQMNVSLMMAAATNDNKWPQQYRNALSRHKATMGHVLKWVRENQDEQNYYELSATVTTLLSMQKKTLELINAGKMEEALAVLNSDDYENYLILNQAKILAVKQNAADALTAQNQRDMRIFRNAVTAFLLISLVLLVAWLRASRNVRKWKSNLAQERKRERKVVGKAVEDGLRYASLRSMTSAVNTAIDGLSMVDLDFTFDYVNPATCKIHGCASPEEMVGRKVSDFLTLETFAELERHAKLALSGEEIEAFEGQAKSNGNLIPIELAPSLVANDHGAPWAFLLIERDVTQQKRVEEELRKSRDFYLTLFEEFPNPVWRSNVRGEFDYFNDSWLTFTGRSLHQELGDGWLESLHPDDRQDFKENYLQSFNAKEPFFKELRLRRNDGAYRWIIDFGKPFYDQDGVFSGYIGACYDVTDHREMEEELALKNRELESFVYTVSHDLRAPLVSLAGFARLLSEEQGDKIGEDGTLYLNRIHANVQSMNNLLSELLELSRVGRQEDPKESVSVNDIVAQVIQDNAATIEAANATLHIASDLPTVDYAPIRLSQIFGNFISNAIKYSNPELPPEIEIGCEQLDKVYRFFIKDNGIGFAPEDAERVFEIFSRLKQKSVEGTGIGLSIVQRIVEKNGGEVGVDSTPGEGSTFWFTVPIIAQSPEEEESCQLVGATQS